MNKVLFLKNVKKTILTGIILIIVPMNLFSQWNLAIDKDSIKVYNKPNDDGYSFYLAEGYLNATINQVYKTFISIEDHPLWISNCAETRVLHEAPDKQIIYYSQYDFPWPSTDRYSISDMHVISKEEKYIKLKSGPAKNQEIIMDNLVYVSRFYEEVEIFYISKNKTKIKLSGAYDPAGAIPAWLTDKFMKQSPYESILKMREILGKEISN